MPIPGSSNPTRIKENCDAVNVRFTNEEIGKINQILSSFELKGGRYMEGVSALSVSFRIIPESVAWLMEAQML
jgi:pyridoxine 4-dehydrogenase